MYDRKQGFFALINPIRAGRNFTIDHGSNSCSTIDPCGFESTMENDVSQLLDESMQGRPESTEKLLVMVYGQLKDIAQRHLSKERSDHSLQPTALVHEAFLKLIDQRNTNWQNTAHFRAIASNIMRRILVDHARAKTAKKRGRGFKRVLIASDPIGYSGNPHDIVALDDLLTHLATLNERHAKIVELRVFGGLSIEETAQAIGVSPATVKNDWRAARAWLVLEMEKGDS